MAMSVAQQDVAAKASASMGRFANQNVRDRTVPGDALQVRQFRLSWVGQNDLVACGNQPAYPTMIDLRGTILNFVR
jgi:hypothetical protein